MQWPCQHAYKNINTIITTVYVGERVFKELEKQYKIFYWSLEVSGKYKKLYFEGGVEFIVRSHLGVVRDFFR